MGGPMDCWTLFRSTAFLLSVDTVTTGASEPRLERILQATGDLPVNGNETSALAQTDDRRLFTVQRLQNVADFANIGEAANPRTLALIVFNDSRQNPWLFGSNEVSREESREEGSWKQETSQARAPGSKLQASVAST